MNVAAVAVSLGILFSQGACHRFEKREGQMWKGQTREVAYDISAFGGDNNFRSKNNPVAVLINKVDDYTMGTCTAFAISKNRIMTNNHCVESEDTGILAQASQLTLHFKNPGDSASTEVKISKIVKHVGVDTDEDYVFFKHESDQDWAILETTSDLSAFSPVTLNTNYAGDKFFTDPDMMTLARINPPAGSDSVWVLDPKPLKIAFSDLVKDSTYMTKINDKAIEDCKTSPKTTDQSTCDSVKIDEQAAVAHLRSMDAFPADSYVRHGNSGSPIFYNGQVYGIIYAGLFSSLHSDHAESTTGILQMFHNIKDDLR